MAFLVALEGDSRVTITHGLLDLPRILATPRKNTLRPKAVASSGRRGDALHLEQFKPRQTDNTAPDEAVGVTSLVSNAVAHTPAGTPVRIGVGTAGDHGMLEVVGQGPRNDARAGWPARLPAQVACGLVELFLDALHRVADSDTAIVPKFVGQLLTCTAETAVCST